MRSCPICDVEPTVVGSRHSPYSNRSFDYAVCGSCGLGLVVDPRTDYENIYDEDYYHGRGPDPDVAYIAEMNDPKSIRNLEWEGLAASVPDAGSPKVLDFGGGLGGLTRILRDRGIESWCFEEEGYAADWLGEHGIPALRELPDGPTFDLVFAVEVMEHLVDPLPVLKAIRSVLNPGGRLVITTGNFARAKQPLPEWYYAAIPDVHVTFWTPSSWARALKLADLVPDHSEPRLSVKVTQYKMLKALPAAAHPLRAVASTWQPLARYVDRRYGVSEFADGVAPAAPS
jgi:SAM-dependent methyltransferase